MLAYDTRSNEMTLMKREETMFKHQCSRWNSSQLGTPYDKYTSLFSFRLSSYLPQSSYFVSSYAGLIISVNTLE